MTLIIDSLSLTLPPGFENRAESIARFLGEELARQPWTESRSLGQLHLGPQTVGPALSDRQIAAQIARAIYQQATGGGGEPC